MKKISIIISICISVSFSNLYAQNKPKSKNKGRLEEVAAPKIETFSIIAFGDMPYFLPEDYARFENLIKEVNNQNQVFNVFVGDIKAAKTKCSEENYQKIYDYFQQFKKPLIYTPGDNEWTDCNKKDAGAYDPEERLDVIRKMFFKEKKSFGIEKLDLISQSQDSIYSKYVENYRWNYKNITFGTVHLVGTNNNYVPDPKNFNKEFYERSKANSAWLTEIFTKAKEEGSLGLVLFVHADMFTSGKEETGFTRFLKELKEVTMDYAKPVLLVHGDSHEFIIDKPLLKDAKSKKQVDNFTRLMVFGEANMHAVKIVVNPANPSLFEIHQLLIPGN